MEIKSISNQQEVFHYTILSSVDLPYAGLPYAWLTNAGLSNAGLSNAGKSNAGLSYAWLSYAWLSYAGLPYAGLSYAGLSYAGLSNAGLSNAGLTNAGLNNAGLTNAGLSNAGLSNAGLPYAGLSNDELSSAKMTLNHFYRPPLSRCQDQSSIENFSGKKDLQNFFQFFHFFLCQNRQAMNCVASVKITYIVVVVSVMELFSRRKKKARSAKVWLLGWSSCSLSSTKSSLVVHSDSKIRWLRV